MKVLAIGDVVGKPGREAVHSLIPVLRKKEKLDFVIANGENAAGGSGLTPKVVKELLSSGIDVITSGDHIWKKKDVLEIIDKEDRLLRPANYPDNVSGCGYVILTLKNGIKIAVINLVGRVFMKALECPFKTARSLVSKIKEETPIVIVDFHAEATSEKITMGWFLDGEVSCVLGTHTHVQTADERILSKNTAYITDLGMTGPLYSVLGRSVEGVLEHFLTGMPARFEMAKEDVELQGVIVDIDEKSGRAHAIKRVKLKLNNAK